KLAQSYHGAKEYEASNRWLDRIVARFPEPVYNALVLELLASNYAALGHHELARDLRRELAERYPDTSYARAARYKMEQDAKREQSRLRNKARLDALKVHAQTAGAEPFGSSRGLLVVVNTAVVVVVGVLLVRRRWQRPV